MTPPTKPRLFSKADIDVRMARMDASATTILLQLQDREKTPIRPNDPTYPRKEACRWAVRHLDLCDRTFKRSPPTPLVDLVAHLLGSSKEPSGNPRRPEFWQAAAFIAEYPAARDNQVGRAVGVSNHTIKN